MTRTRNRTMLETTILLYCWVTLMSFSSFSLAFVSIVSKDVVVRRSNNIGSWSRYDTSVIRLKKYKFDEDFFKNNDENDDEEDHHDDDGPVTREMLLRDMLSVKRKKKNGKSGFRTLDNRDNLPFVVKLMTPDPYTPFALRQAETKRNLKKSQQAKKDQDQNNVNKNNKQRKKKVKRTDLVENGIAGSIYKMSSSKNKKGSKKQTLDERFLGEFKLDKSTQSGDIISIGDVEYEVQVARCQYKYAGGKRFVMVRKILEVKEISRAQQEEMVTKMFQLDATTVSKSGIPPNEII